MMSDQRMPIDPLGGVHIRGVASVAKEEPNVALLTVQIWPLPYDIVAELNDEIKRVANKFLADRQIVSGEMSDLHTTGKPN